MAWCDCSLSPLGAASIVHGRLSMKKSKETAGQKDPTCSQRLFPEQCWGLTPLSSFLRVARKWGYCLQPQLQNPSPGKWGLTFAVR